MPNSSDSTQTTQTTAPTASSPLFTRLRNLVVVLVAVGLSVAIFLGLQTSSNTATLAAMADESAPLAVALNNGKPTLMEFYADWCTACQAMAQDMGELKQAYGDRVNFVMLNVDNSKWLPEMLRYRVDGIPHFVFLNPEAEPIASTIGEQPRTIMAANLEALATGADLPYAQTRGRMSEVEAATAPKPRSDDPRSHGSQVVVPAL
ncbi:MAG: thioredoxin family protein [Elainellaceae cyanobacterium]